MKRLNKRLVSELSLTKSSVKSNDIVWEQPDTDKEVCYGVVGGKIFFKIQRRGYEFNCSSTNEAFIGIYDDWGNSLKVLKKRARVALEKRGIVNHALN